MLDGCPPSNFKFVDFVFLLHTLDVHDTTVCILYQEYKNVQLVAHLLYCIAVQNMPRTGVQIVRAQ